MGAANDAAVMRPFFTASQAFCIDCETLITLPGIGITGELMNDVTEDGRVARDEHAPPIITKRGTSR